MASSGDGRLDRTPSEREPWPVSAGQLFDTGSKRRMSCEQWLGQQVVMFDGQGISLREDHSDGRELRGSPRDQRIPPVRRGGTQTRKPVREAALHILNNVTFFGIRYTHLVVIETALHLYDRLLKETSIQRPGGETYLVKPAFACLEDQAISSRPDWLRFDGTMVMVFSNEPKLTRHTIKPVG